VALVAGLCAVGDAAQPNALAATAIAAGFGSKEQQRLFGLLCSLLKRSGMLTSTQQTSADECRLVAASAAVRIAKLYAEHSAASSTSAAAASASASSCVSQLLPWLVLFGRCCLQWAVQLQWRLQGIPNLPDAAAVQQDQFMTGGLINHTGIYSCADVFFFSAATGAHAGTQPMPIMALFLSALQAPLLDAGIAAQILAAGADARILLSKIQSAAAAVTAGHVDKPDDVIAAVKGLGEALTSLPCTIACNNPLCSNIAGTSEQQLVQGSQHKCSACRTARYCCKQC
jgi:hypothetical protein